MLKRAPIQEIEELVFISLNSEEFEEITNSQNYNFKIQNLIYRESWESISDLSLANISKINPQKLYLADLNSISVAMNIFLGLSSKININFGHISKYGYEFITFRDTSILIKYKDNSVRVHWEKIFIEFNEDKGNEDFIILEDYICIAKLDSFNCKNLRKDNLTTKFTQDVLSFMDIKHESYILTPINSLSHLRLKWSKFTNLFEKESNKLNFKKLYLNANVIIELNSINDLEFVYQFSEWILEHWNFELRFDSTYVYPIDILNKRLNIFTKFKLTKVYCYCGDESIEALKLFLESPCIQKIIQELQLWDLNIINCINILSLCVKCKELKLLAINSNEYDGDEIEESKREIDKIKEEILNFNTDIDIQIEFVYQ